MSQSYFSLKKLRRQSKQPEATETTTATTSSPPAPAISTPSEEPAASPVLEEEDEKFLQRLAAIFEEPDGTPPPLPTRPVEIVDNGETKVGKDAKEAIMDGANQMPLPMSPPEVTTGDAEKGKEKAKNGGLNRRKSVMSYFSLAQSKLKKATEKDTGNENKSKGKKKDKITTKDKQKAADNLHAAAEATRSAEQKEADKEQQDITQILDQLNLSAVNNRVFSFSKESEELFNKFNLVLKDVVNGVPTAYNDLEKLFTDYEGQLKKMYGGLPPFLQNLVKSLPAKLTATLGPEILAAQAEKPGFDAKQRAGASGGAKSKFKRPVIPSLKSLISAEGAVATMLRSILQFLKLRFPAVLTGTNVVMSLAVCILLFVFWYCHKRGREIRLEKEALAANEVDPALVSSASSFTDDSDSIFGDPAKAKVNAKAVGESSKSKDAERPAPPLIIGDGKEGEPGSPTADVEDMPSVKDLPDPGSAKKEDPAKV